MWNEHWTGALTCGEPQCLGVLQSSGKLICSALLILGSRPYLYSLPSNQTPNPMAQFCPFVNSKPGSGAPPPIPRLFTGDPKVRRECQCPLH